MAETHAHHAMSGLEEVRVRRARAVPQIEKDGGLEIRRTDVAEGGLRFGVGCMHESASRLGAAGPDVEKMRKGRADRF